MGPLLQVLYCAWPYFVVILNCVTAMDVSSIKSCWYVLPHFYITAISFSIIYFQRLSDSHQHTYSLGCGNTWTNKPYWPE